jgi:large subunit ribosomal protein L22
VTPARPSDAADVPPPPRRLESRAVRHNVPTSPWKLNEICRTVRGLSVHEALLQLRLSIKGKARYVANCIRNAKQAGIHNFDMDPTRMVVAEAYTSVGSGRIMRPHYGSRGRMRMVRINRANLYVVVRQVEPAPREARLGRWGRKHSTIQRTLERMREFRASKAQREEAATRRAAEIKAATDAVLAARGAGAAP